MELVWPVYFHIGKTLLWIVFAEKIGNIYLSFFTAIKHNGAVSQDHLNWRNIDHRMDVCHMVGIFKSLIDVFTDRTEAKFLRKKEDMHSFAVLKPPTGIFVQS